jgi:hypothetical protein
MRGRLGAEGEHVDGRLVADQRPLLRSSSIDALRVDDLRLLDEAEAERRVRVDRVDPLLDRLGEALLGDGRLLEVEPDRDREVEVEVARAELALGLVGVGAADVGQLDLGAGGLIESRIQP